ncbi:immunoglobulin-like domain-containing protein, partial [Vibrio cyclitrophicus]
ITDATGGNFESLVKDPTAATTTINDDSDVTTVSLSADASVTEGENITYTATLTNPADGAVTVTLSNGATITIADGATSGTTTVPASDDVYVGGDTASAT